MEIKYKKIVSISELIDAIRLRVDVFIKEQKNQPGWEPDVEDKIADHYVATIEEEVVATARVRETNSEYKIERMAVKKEFRGKGVGKGLVNYIVGEIKKEKPSKIWLQAQIQAQEFYEKSNFRSISKPYDLYGIAHIDMKLLNPS